MGSGGYPSNQSGNQSGNQSLLKSKGTRSVFGIYYGQPYGQPYPAWSTILQRASLFPPFIPHLQQEIGDGSTKPTKNTSLHQIFVGFPFHECSMEASFRGHRWSSGSSSRRCCPKRWWLHPSRGSSPFEMPTP